MDTRTGAPSHDHSDAAVSRPGSRLLTAGAPPAEPHAARDSGGQAKATKIPFQGFDEPPAQWVTAPKPVWGGLPKPKARQRPQIRRRGSLPRPLRPGARPTPRERHEALRAVYRDRGEILAEMGFTSYAAYVSSPLWRRIRREAMERSKHLCDACRREARHVYLLDFEPATLNGDQPASVATICELCIAKAQFSDDGKRNILEAANAAVARKPAKASRSVRKRRDTQRRLNNLRNAALNAPLSGRAERTAGDMGEGQR